jgi:hypothetical protein
MQYEKLTQPSKIDFSHDPDGVWFGDPCYVVPEDQWLHFCNLMFAYEEKNKLERHYVGEVTDESTGLNWYCWNTAYGDGCYTLQVNGNSVASLGVDAGMLSAIPMRLIKHWTKTGDISDHEGLGHVLDSDICVGQLDTSEGDMYFGYNITLPTGEQYNLHDEEEEEEQCVEEGYFC